jgi:hypothetical protein
MEKYISPYAHRRNAIRASARKYRDLSNELGIAFREAQQESYEGFVASQDESHKTGFDKPTNR